MTPPFVPGGKHASDAQSILAGIEGGKPEAYSRNQIAYCQGEPADFVFYVLAGNVKVTVVSEDGREAVVAILQPGSFCGEEGIVGHELRTATGTALTECVLLRMPNAGVIRALDDDPGFSRLFTTYLMERSIRMQEDLVDQLLNSTEKRLGRLLLILANYGKENWQDPIVPKINQETLAEAIGTTRSHISFFMNKFRQLGLIDYEGDTNGEIKVNRSLLKMLLHGKSHVESQD
jgi:CRP/FNR family cyclic AMP-dependent transcriptional regulator